MTAARWLHRLVEVEPNTGKRRRAMERRFREKARACTPWEARAYLESFTGEALGCTTASRDLQVRWIGCWSQSLDAHLRRALGKRLP